MDLWEIYKASKGVPHSGDLYDALMGKALGGAGSVWETENAPYFFRQSGGVLNSRLLGKEKDTIVGASVGFNQLIKPFTADNWSSEAGVTATYSDGVATLTNPTTANNGIYTPITLVSGHKYFISAEVSTTEAKTVNVGRGSAGVYIYADMPANSGFKQWSKVCSASSSGTTNMFIYGTGGEYTNLKAKNFIVIDLTLMLGSTIADYAYTLETQTAGSGVAWLKQYFFSEPYYAYDGGSIKSVSGLVRHEMKDGNDNVIGSYPLDSTVELRGLFKMDADHNIYADGDTYEADGTVTRKWKEIGISTFSGNIGSDAPNSNGVIRFVCNTADKKMGATNVISSMFPTNNDIILTTTDQELVSGYSGGVAVYVSIKASRLTGDLTTAEGRATAFKNWCGANNFKVLYELATPTTDTATPFASPQNVDKDGTEEYVTTQKFVPIGHETQYKCTPTP